MYRVRRRFHQGVVLISQSLPSSTIAPDANDAQGESQTADGSPGALGDPGLLDAVPYHLAVDVVALLQIDPAALAVAGGVVSQIVVVLAQGVVDTAAGSGDERGPQQVGMAGARGREDKGEREGRDGSGGEQADVALSGVLDGQEGGVAVDGGGQLENGGESSGAERVRDALRLSACGGVDGCGGEKMADSPSAGPG